MRASSAIARAFIPALALVSSVNAMWTLETLSFGHKRPLSSDGRTIPGWAITGENFSPQILSDRVILTSVAPGAKRGAVWATGTLKSPEWVAALAFRASGPERGGGNLQIWYTQKNQGTSSLYTVGQFDGLVLVFDQYGGHGGGIRAFLNDGATDFKTHHNIDRLPFGKCDYSYRNRGAFTNLEMRQGQGFFEVKVDDQLCFRTENMQLPQDYFFGITAASADVADAFEINKFVVSGSDSAIQGSGQQQQQQQQKANSQNIPQPTSHNLPPIDPNANLQQSFGRTAGGPLDGQASEVVQKLLPVADKVEDIYKVIFALDKRLEDRHNQLVNRIASSGGSGGSGAGGVTSEQLRLVEGRLKVIEETMNHILQDLEGKDYEDHLNILADTVRRQHSSLMSSLPGTMTQILTSSKPRMGFFVFLILGFQVVLVVAYVVYKRRRNSMPKKFL